MLWKGWQGANGITHMGSFNFDRAASIAANLFVFPREFDAVLNPLSVFVVLLSP